MTETQSKPKSVSGCMNAANTSAVRNKFFRENAWGERHAQAWIVPHKPFEHSIKSMLYALAVYADEHEKTYYSKIGQDGFLGPAWLKMLKSFRTLLNGDLGRFDGGTLNGCCFDMADAAGFEEGALDE